MINRPAAPQAASATAAGRRVSLVHADGQDEAAQEPAGNGVDAKQLTGGFPEGKRAGLPVAAGDSARRSARR